MSASTILTRLKRTHYDISPEEYLGQVEAAERLSDGGASYAAARSHLAKSNAAWQCGSRSDRATTRRMIAPQVANLGFEREISMGLL